MALARSVDSASTRIWSSTTPAGGRTAEGDRRAWLHRDWMAARIFGRIFRSERELLALDFEGIVIEVAGDFLKGLGGDAGDFGKAEVGVAELIVLKDEVVGVAAGDAGAVLAELLPGEAEVIQHAGIADLPEALGAGRRATAGNGGEGVLEAGPGAEVALFFDIHEVFRNDRSGIGRGLVESRGVGGGTPARSIRNRAFRRSVPARLLTYLIRLSRAGGGAAEWERGGMRDWSFLFFAWKI
jgi:hypothetical protein